MEDFLWKNRILITLALVTVSTIATVISLDSNGDHPLWWKVMIVATMLVNLALLAVLQKKKGSEG